MCPPIGSILEEPHTKYSHIRFLHNVSTVHQVQEPQTAQHQHFLIHQNTITLIQSAYHIYSNKTRILSHQLVAQCFYLLIIALTISALAAGHLQGAQQFFEVCS